MTTLPGGTSFSAILRTRAAAPIELLDAARDCCEVTTPVSNCTAGQARHAGRTCHSSHAPTASPTTVLG